ncbi:MAG: fructose-bisphosphate aldolase class I [Cyanobacteria bacterium RU_5_0]|nr:fructose-bisphosphate aldolase class I [Cyanobacteria bacterium RU_5_0]
MNTYAQELRATAQAMVAPGKGILAMDESNGTCNKRFEKLGIPTTEERRRAYRELILTTPNLSPPALERWRGHDANVSVAQQLLYHRTKLNSAASSGQYTSEMEKAPALV